VARALVAAGVPSLSVATFDEGLELRQAGIAVPILVLFPIRPSSCPTRCASVSRSRPATGRSWSGPWRCSTAWTTPPSRPRPASRPLRVADPPRSRPVSVAAASTRPISRRAAAIGLRRGSTGRPLVAPPGGRRPGSTADQAARLGVASSLLEEVGITMPTAISPPAAVCSRQRAGLRRRPHRPRHVRHRARRADGGRAPHGRRSRLRPVLSLRARPVRVTELPAGTGVSYGPTFVTARPSRIATLPLGYADGLPRSLSNKAQVLVRGGGSGRRHSGHGRCDDRRHRRSGAPVSVDDEFTLIGTQGGEAIDAIEMARGGNTISYEDRDRDVRAVTRVYYAAARAVQMRAVACELGWGGGEFGRPDHPGAIEDEPGPLGCE